MFAEVRSQVQLFPRPYTQEYPPATYAPQVNLWIYCRFKRNANKGTPSTPRGDGSGAAQSEIEYQRYANLRRAPS